MTTDSFRVVWSPESEDDLLSIWRWGAARFSPAIADGHLRDIHRAAMRLAASPLMGRERDDLRSWHPSNCRLSDRAVLPRYSRPD